VNGGGGGGVEGGLGLDRALRLRPPKRFNGVNGFNSPKQLYCIILTIIRSLRHLLVSFDPKDPYYLLLLPVDSGAAHGLRDEIALLHSHLLYERQRREVLGARNRRLLG
jgi:hypothetical protein